MTEDCETTNGSIDPTLTSGKLCGTDSTPPCPIAEFYVERNELIYQLAGPRPSQERLRKVAARVDQYLATVIRGVRVLDRTTEHPPVQRDPGSEVEARIETQVEIVEVIVK